MTTQTVRATAGQRVAVVTRRDAALNGLADMLIEANGLPPESRLQRFGTRGVSLMAAAIREHGEVCRIGTDVGHARGGYYQVPDGRIFDGSGVHVQLTVKL